MDKKPDRPVARSLRDLSAEARIRELASLSAELHRPEPITHSQLSNWIGGSSDRRAVGGERLGRYPLVKKLR